MTRRAAVVSPHWTVGQYLPCVPPAAARPAPPATAPA